MFTNEYVEIHIHIALAEMCFCPRRNIIPTRTIIQGGCRRRRCCFDHFEKWITPPPWRTQLLFRFFQWLVGILLFLSIFLILICFNQVNACRACGVCENDALKIWGNFVQSFVQTLDLSYIRGLI